MPWTSVDTWEEPELTLGWLIADWAEAYLRVPGGVQYGEPLRLTGWQLRALADWYAIDRVGRPLYRRGQVRKAKGTGKSPWAGVPCLAELCGPVVFDGLNAAGEPVGKPRPAPWVQIAAVSEEQTGNTYSAVRAMLAGSPLIDEAGIDLGLTRVLLRGRPGKLEMVTASAGSREGQPVTFVLGDETHLWTRTNGGRKLYATLRRNASKMGTRVLTTTNAWVPGDESVAEQIEAAAVTTAGLMIYGPQYEAHVDDVQDRDKLAAGVAFTYRDAPWVDQERIVTDCLDPDMQVEDVHRFHLNRPVAADSVLCTTPTVSLDGLEAGAPVAVGFDGSRTSDATAVVAVHMVTGVATLVGYWERPFGHPKRERWEVPRHEVDQVVDRLFARFHVVRVKADPSHWQDEVAGWQNRHGKDRVDRFPVWQHSIVDQAVEATQTALQSSALQLAAGGDELDRVLAAHVQRCVVSRRTVGSRVLRSIGKPDDGGRVDAAAALVYGWQARLEALANGWEPSQPTPSPVVVWG